MEKGQMEDLLIAILDCGYLDLKILDGCKYDIRELIDNLHDMGYTKVDINNLCYAMFDKGLCELNEAIYNRIEEEDNNELKALFKELNPFEDTESYHNYIDTSISFTDDDKEAIYKKYFKDELDLFEHNTGFTIGGD